MSEILTISEKILSLHFNDDLKNYYTYILDYLLQGYHVISVSEFVPVFIMVLATHWDTILTSHQWERKGGKLNSDVYKPSTGRRTTLGAKMMVS